MKHMRSLLIAFALLSLSCTVLGQSLSFPGGTATAAQPGCPDPEPTQEFIDAALAYKSQNFESGDWKRSYTVMESGVMVTWRDDNLGAIINFDHVIFCDVSSVNLDEYYSASYFDTIFQNYEGHEASRDCRVDELRLYEFKVKSSGYDYNARFWAEVVDGDHTRHTLVVFPIADLANLTSYSQALMPELPGCE